MSMKQYKIKPYRHFSNKEMPTTRTKNDLKIKWWPILTKMMETPGLNMNAVPNDVVLKESYEAAMDNLHSRFSFLFVPAAKDSMKKWALSTWSKRTQHSYVMKNDTDGDKHQLSEPSKCNQKHNEKRSFIVICSRPKKAKKRHSIV